MDFYSLRQGEPAVDDEGEFTVEVAGMLGFTHAYINLRVEGETLHVHVETQPTIKEDAKVLLETTVRL